MPVTVVRCSHPDCQAEAAYRVGSPWQQGQFAELKTLGYSCPAHTEKVVARISVRPKTRHPSPGEVRIYNLARA